MRKQTPSYIAEYQLIPVQQDGFAVLYHAEHEAHRVYCMCLQEALTRLHKARHDEKYKTLCDQLALAKNDERQAAAIRIQIAEHYRSYGYSEYALHAYVAEHCRKYVNLGIDEKQKLATRAFRAVEKMRKGNAKHVRFPGSWESLSFEGKSCRSKLHLKSGEHVVCFGKDHQFELLVEPADEYAMLCMTDRCKYVRILKRKIRGKDRWYAQLVMEGTPPSKNRKMGEGTVGLDIGISTIAISSDSAVELHELAPHCRTDEHKIRRLQRAIGRSKRAMNPDNYNKNGTVKKGRRVWKKSKRYIRLQKKLSELQRKAAAHRKQAHEILANHIVAMGDDIRIEQMRMQGLASRSKQTTRNAENGKINSKKRYGHTIGIRAPSMLVESINRKLGYHGKQIVKVNTYTVKASQYNPVDGTYKRKDLKDRLIQLDENIYVQRDMLSAYLIQHTNSTYDMIDSDSAYNDFPHFKVLQDAELRHLKEENALSWYISAH